MTSYVLTVRIPCVDGDQLLQRINQAEGIGGEVSGVDVIKEA